MKALNKHPKKVFMWHKVNELKSKGFNKTQIANEVGIHRKTVRKYLTMSEEEFYKWIEKGKNLPKKLQIYHSFVYNLLDSYPYFSAAQIEDRLKENFKELPMVHSKTVYNFVENIRKKYGIKKEAVKEPRQYEKLSESDYGQYAQVDFGQYNMITKDNGRKKVYFFVMVLCRSRHKFVYFQKEPFTTSSAIKAHEIAFEYFEGQPHKIIYDQDRVFIVDENMGDVLLTREFTGFCQQMSFETVFCRKSDPESKGKVENAVKYVKYNFLKGRVYCGDEELNKSVHGWLMRTANGKEHAGIKKIPYQEWLIEKEHLLPVKPFKGTNKIQDLPKYKVRKDNTISYKSNFYSLPLGTYLNQDTWVSLKAEEETILIYDNQNKLLAEHPLCCQRGMTISNTDHRRDKSQSILKLKENILEALPDKETGELFINMVSKDKPRYVRDSLLLIKKHVSELDPDIIQKAITFCLENSEYRASRFVEVAKFYLHEQLQINNAKAIISGPMIKNESCILDIIPKYSQISVYETIL